MIEGPNGNNISRAPTPEVIFEGGHWILRSSFAAIDEADEAFEGLLKEKNWNEDQAYFLALDLHEVLVNAFMHGNLRVEKHGSQTATQAVEDALAANPEFANKKIIVDVSITEEEGQKVLKIRVEDEGPGFDFNAVADPTTEKNKKKTEGRGINWLEHYYDEVKYDPPGNVVHLLAREKKIVV